MADDRAVLIGESNQLIVSEPFVGNTQYAALEGTDEFVAYEPITIGHWSYSVRFEHYPPLCSIDLQWLYSYIPPPSVDQGEDRKFTPGRYKDFQAESFFVDQTRWIYPDGIDSLRTDWFCAWDTSFDVDWIIYPPLPSIDLKYSVCYAPPYTVGGAQNRGMQVAGKEHTEYGEFTVGIPFEFDVEGVDSFVPGTMCVVREIFNPWWRIYPPPSSIDLYYYGCYVVPNTVSYDAVYTREMLISGWDLFATAEHRVSPTQYAEITETDQSGSSRYCVTRPFATVWYIYPPLPSVDLVFHCAYRPPRAFPSSGAVIISALYQVDPYTEAKQIIIADFDQLQVSNDTLVEAGEYIPPQEIIFEGVDTLVVDAPGVYYYDTYTEVEGIDSFGTDTHAIKNLDSYLVKGEQDTLETGDISVYLWEQFVNVTEQDSQGIDPSGHKVELADQVIQIIGSDQFLTSNTHIVAIYEPIVISGENFTVAGTPAIGHYFQYADFLHTTHSAYGAFTVGTEQTALIDWTVPFVAGTPTVIRYLVIEPFTDYQQTNYGIPVVISYQTIVVYEEPQGTLLGEFVVKNFDQQVWLPTDTEQFIPGLAWIGTDQFAEFRDDIETKPQTIYSEATKVTNQHRELHVPTLESFEQSYEIVVTKNLAANFDGYDATDVGTPWVSFYVRSIEMWAWEMGFFGSFEVKRGARLVTIDGSLQTKYDPYNIYWWTRNIQIGSEFAQTETGTPTVGQPRNIVVPRTDAVHKTEYGDLLVTHWEQTIVPADTDTLQTDRWMVEERVNRILPPSLLIITEYGNISIKNLNRELSIGGPTYTDYGLTTVELWTRYVEIQEQNTLQTEYPEMIWAHTVTLTHRHEIEKPETEYGEFDLRNELNVEPYSEQTIWIPKKLGEGETAPQTQYGTSILSAQRVIRVQEASFFAAGEIDVSGGIWLTEAAPSLQLGSIFVSDGTRTVKIAEGADPDELIGDVTVSPFYIYVGEQGSIDKPPYEPNPGPIEVRSTIHDVLVNESYQGAFGDIRVTQTGWRIDLAGTSSLSVGHPTITPHTKYVFMPEHNSFAAGNPTVEGGESVPTDVTITVGESSQFNMSTFMVELQNRKVTIQESDQTEPNRGFDVDFEKRIHPVDLSLLLPGVPWLSTDPQYPLMEPGLDSLDTNPGLFNNSMKIEHDQQMPAFIGVAMLAMAQPHVDYAEPVPERNWECT